MKIKLFMLLLLLASALNLAWAEPSTLLEKVEDNTEVIDLYLAGQYLPGKMLSVYFNISQGEFINLVDVNNIENIKIDILKKNMENNAVKLVASETLTEVNIDFDVNTWSILIENVDSLTQQYFTQVTINNGDCGAQTPLTIVTESFEDEDSDDDLPIELPEYNCGDDFSNIDVSDQTPLASASEGDVFLINGFPILIKQVTGGNGSFSGLGVVPLPFDNKVIDVSFDQISVNDQFQVYQGTVEAIPDVPGNYPDFSPDTGAVNIGGEICLPPPPPAGQDQDGIDNVTGLDTWGFDPETGLHSETGTQYDQNGFDVNGNHIDTGGPYNAQGCNRDGMMEDGTPCDPSGGPNPQAEAFADQLSDTISIMLSGIIDQLETELQNNITNLNCDNIRTNLESLITTLGYNREFIFGENDKYLNEEMHLAFSNPPQKMTLDIERDQNVKDLEENHLALFDCDKSEYKFKALLSSLQSIDLSVLSVDILAAIASWSEYEYSIYSNDTDAFNGWLSKQIGKEMKENSGLSDNYFVRAEENSSNHPLKQKLESIFNFDPSKYQNVLTASNDVQLFSNQFTLRDASFLFLQGSKRINGVDRAYYLEELANQQANTTSENFLPAEITKSVGNKTYTIYLDNIVFTTTGALLDAYIIIEDQESQKKLVFKAFNIAFGPTGLQTESHLYLDTDVEIRLNNAAMLVLKGTENSYVSWDCEGFSGMGIDAEIEFCRNFITPLDPTTLEPLPDPERYRLQLQIQDINSWLEFYLVVDAPPFAVTNYEDVKWQASNIVLDFSSEETPPFVPLEGYDCPFWDGSSMSPLWKGFYMENLSVQFPNSFSSGSEPITASAFDIMIDAFGFSGGVAVDNLLSIDEGNLGGWPMSIEGFELRILKNQFGGAGLKGEINVPIFEENMDYEAVMYSSDNYSFAVSPDSNLTADVFVATVSLNENSEVRIGKENGEFLAVATLHGHVSIGSDLDGLDVNFPQLCFQDFQVSNQAPYFSAGTWGLPNNGDLSASASFGGFGISLNNIKPYKPADGKVGLGFNIVVQLEQGLSITAGGGIGIVGVLEEQNGRQSWNYEGIELQSFLIDASFPGAKIKGALEWYGNTEPDPNWGKGFRGILDAQFEGLGGVGLEAVAQFGSKDDYKYFFVDAVANLGAAGLGTGLLQIKGFGGGISYNMDSNSPSNVPIQMETATIPTLPPLGTSLSGRVYTPDSTKGLGLKANARIATADDKIFSGVVGLEFLFNDDNGLSKIALSGSGQFLADIDLGIVADILPDGVEPTGPPPSVNSALSAYIDLEFNFEEPSFHGTLISYLNTPFVYGSGQNGKLVDAELHFDPEKWYIYIGRPEEGQRCGITFDLFGVAQLESTAYLDIGTDIPPIPPLPQNVQQIAYKVNKNESLRQSGTGFVIGAAISYSMGASISGIVSATLEAEAGFDMMLRRYDGLSCQGSNEPVGIDGWYASGQMWAYASGSLEVFGVNIASAGIAAVLQARLPNPFFAQATVGVQVRMLFVTVSKSLKLQLGEDCILVSDDPNDELGMEVITLLQPIDGGTEIETYAQPEAQFALEVNKNYEIADLDGNLHTYRVQNIRTELTDSFGNEIPHDRNLNESYTGITVIPADAMPGADSITFTVTVDVYKNGDLLTEESKSTTFATAESLNYIPENNVKAAYPADGMANFYKSEYNLEEGFITLITGQPDLILNIPFGYEQKIRLTSSDGNVQYFDYDYNAIANRIYFPLPSSQLENETLYKLELVRIAEGSGTSYNASNSTGSGNDNLLDIALSPSNIPSEPSSSGNELNEGIQSESILYTAYFRTSSYDTFAEKIEAVNNNDPSFRKSLSEPAEHIDDLERVGSNKYDRLIQYEVNLNNDWVKDHINPLLADMDEFLCDQYKAGFDPDFALANNSLGLKSVVNQGSISKDHFINNQFEFQMDQSMRLVLDRTAEDVIIAGQQIMQACYTQEYMENNFGVDCYDSEQLENSPGCLKYNKYMNLKDATIPAISNGTYQATVTYRLPGTNIITTSRTLSFTK